MCLPPFYVYFLLFSGLLAQGQMLFLAPVLGLVWVCWVFCVFFFYYLSFNQVFLLARINRMFRDSGYDNQSLTAFVTRHTLGLPCVQALAQLDLQQALFIWDGLHDLRGLLQLCFQHRLTGNVPRDAEQLSGLSLHLREYHLPTPQPFPF